MDWGSLPASARAKVIARAMVANFGTCAVEEDDEKITLSFHCGSGGRLIDDGRYDGDDGYLVLRERGAAHVHARRAARLLRALLGQQRDAAGGVGRHARRASSTPPAGKGDACVHHVYKDVDAIPASAYERIGKKKPG